MKPFEEAFASDVFRRVILPGIVLSAGVHPLILRWMPVVQDLYGLGPIALIIVEIVVLGLGISSAIQWIYYVYEGFRLEWLTWVAGWFNRRHLTLQQKRHQQIQGTRDFDDLTPSEQSQVIKIYEDLLDFPVRRLQSGLTEHFVERPTRLGNIIATYELYAESRYGIDGMHFWNHFLSLASDTNRKAFEEKYSFAESLLLASFAGTVVVALNLLVLLGFAIGTLDDSLILFHLSTRPGISAWLTLFGLAVWLLFYKASLPAHRDAGDAFRAIVDSVLPKFVEWATAMACPLPEETVEKVTRLKKYLTTLK